MHWTLSLIIALVAWAYSATRWRPASGVLAIMWVLAQCYWMQTGESVPIPLYASTDFIIFGALLLFTHGGWTDTFIAALLVIQFKCYVDLREGSAQQWWCLWVLACMQMIAAGPWAQVFRIGKTHAERIFHPDRNRPGAGRSLPRHQLLDHPIALSGQLR